MDFDKKAESLFAQLTLLKPTTINPQQENLLQLQQFYQLIKENQFQQQQKIQSLKLGIKRISAYIHRENEQRLNNNTNIRDQISKVELKLKSSIAILNKTYQSSETKLMEMLERVLNDSRKKIEKMISDEQFVETIQTVKAKVAQVRGKINQAKRQRKMLEDKIFNQFKEQIQQLRLALEIDSRERDQKEAHIISRLKNVYSTAMDSIKNEQSARNNTERMLLSIMEQLVGRLL